MLFIDEAQVSFLEDMMADEEGYLELRPPADGARLPALVDGLIGRRWCRATSKANVPRRCQPDRVERGIHPHALSHALEMFRHLLLRQSFGNRTFRG